MCHSIAKSAEKSPTAGWGLICACLVYALPLMFGFLFGMTAPAIQQSSSWQNKVLTVVDVEGRPDRGPCTYFFDDKGSIASTELESTTAGAAFLKTLTCSAEALGRKTSAFVLADDDSSSVNNQYCFGPTAPKTVIKDDFSYTFGIAMGFGMSSPGLLAGIWGFLFLACHHSKAINQCARRINICYVFMLGFLTLAGCMIFLLALPAPRLDTFVCQIVAVQVRDTIAKPCQDLTVRMYDAELNRTVVFQNMPPDSWPDLPAFNCSSVIARKRRCYADASDLTSSSGGNPVRGNSAANAPNICPTFKTQSAADTSLPFSFRESLIIPEPDTGPPRSQAGEDEWLVGWLVGGIVGLGGALISFCSRGCCAPPEVKQQQEQQERQERRNPVFVHATPPRDGTAEREEALRRERRAIEREREELERERKLGEEEASAKRMAAKRDRAPSYTVEESAGKAAVEMPPAYDDNNNNDNESDDAPAVIKLDLGL
eukprot:PLAT11209.1.p1 GENE.PLAT11209.1~~PLAT11209.1.p1  ORF type:complete len:486 (+),score=69.12 PLAT11209.1:2-1459(+)